MKFFRYFLFPISFAYGLVVKTRNLLFDCGALRSFEVNVPTISVGNLTVGGTGKTPQIEYLIGLLSPHFKLAVLSRGYKRKTVGFQYVSFNSHATRVGDEPLLLKTNNPQIAVAVDGNRVRGVNRLIQDDANLDVVLLDDALQHRHIKPGLSILLVDYSRPIWSDLFLPLGALRDSYRERRRADMIVFTKCPPNLTGTDKKRATQALRPSPRQTIFFSRVWYGNPLPVFPDAAKPDSIGKTTHMVAFSGIANPTPFFNYIANFGQLRESLAFPDHHFFSEKEIRAIFDRFLAIETVNKAIVTTQKDAVRLQGLQHLPHSMKSNIFFIPIKAIFEGENQQQFNKQIINYVGTSKTNNRVHQGPD